MQPERRHWRVKAADLAQELLDGNQRKFDAGMIPVGTSPNGLLAEVVEIESHPWFVGVQYHPEFKSKPF